MIRDKLRYNFEKMQLNSENMNTIKLFQINQISTLNNP